MVQALFGFILLADLFLFLVIAISIFFPKHRIWPPNKEGYLAAMGKLDAFHHRYVWCAFYRSTRLSVFDY